MNIHTNNLVPLFGEAIGMTNVIHGEALGNRDRGYCEDCHTAGILLLPRSTADVSHICKIASDHGISVVPQGGLTGLVDGTASHSGQVCVSFERMNRIIQIDPAQAIAVVEPGVILQNLFEATEPFDLMPGIDIPSKGSCTIGGLVSTNAGGVRVLRYGMMRENVLGLEVVLANGEILDAANRLMKNNAGYDMKQLFIGSEGSLGLVTGIVLRLHPVPRSTALALVACERLDSLIALLEQARKDLQSKLLSFEVMWPEYLQLTTTQPGMESSPIDTNYNLYAVIEVAGSDSEDSATALNNLLEQAFEEELVVDGVIAGSEAQRLAIWRTREDSDAIESTCDAYLSYDVGMQLQHLEPYVERFRSEFRARYPDRVPYIFGHMGDGNLHIMFAVSPEEYRNRQGFDEIVYGALGGFESATISAEHGIGLEKKDYLERSRSDVYVNWMRRIKATLDPGDVLNPGKIF